MKKIPGTLFHLGISSSKDDKFLLNVQYRDQLVYERTGLIKEAITNEVQFFFESKNLSIPRNRIDWIVNEELSNVSSTNDESFIESTVTDLLGEFQRKPTEEMKKIILIGLSNAGKTCIYERVFGGKKPYELLNSAATKGISYNEYKVGSITKPMIWDLGGQQQYLDEYHGVLRSNIFRKASILLYVIDVTDTDRFEDAREELEWSVNQIISFNPEAMINVFFHKIDLVHDEDALAAYLKKFLSQNISHKITFHSTSIFGQSLFSAWSEIIREISPKTTFINSILNSLKNHKDVKDAVLLEKSTGLACGSTLDIKDEDIAVGMLSLLIVTINKVIREMKLHNFKEFKLKTDANYVLIYDVTQDLLLIIILTSANLSSESILEIEEIGIEVSKQIRNLWIE
ncbi:MAG: roadblock/LC7 domain-containing protein [Candidatus Lokiarchaeota archaeon]|nr:roadblock/LC7 domain-containing protein [Candidatus Lokiarchaeota archaeon]